MSRPPLHLLPFAMIAFIGCDLPTSGLLALSTDAGPLGNASGGTPRDSGAGGDGAASTMDASPADPPPEPDSSADDGAADAGEDAAAEDAGAPVDAACPGVMCNGVCTGSSTCASCAGAPLLCEWTNSCVPSCNGCGAASMTALPIECFACDENHANPVGTCQPANGSAYCLSGDYSTAYIDGGVGTHCGCSTKPATKEACPGTTQVCVWFESSAPQYQCATCGENTSSGSTTDGQNCGTPGMSCSATTASCN